MAEKKTTGKARCGTAKKTASAGVKKGDAYVCEVCGLAVTVDEACGCVDVCDIICCGKSMKERKIKTKAVKK